MVQRSYRGNHRTRAAYRRVHLNWRVSCPQVGDGAPGVYERLVRCALLSVRKRSPVRSPKTGHDCGDHVASTPWLASQTDRLRRNSQNMKQLEQRAEKQASCWLLGCRFVWALDRALSRAALH